MAYGYHGRILRLDLSTGAISFDEHDEVWYRRYMGGAAASAYYLLKETKPRAAPLGPDNILVFAPGVITGAPASGTGRHSVGAKSPASGGLGKSEAGGHFGAELKRAGLDGVVVTGEAERPVYLWINDGKVELRDAVALWGLPTAEAEEAIRAEVGDHLARSALIGPAGEKLVRFACVIHDLRDAAGRGGLGAVMGAKKLKGIAVRGRTGVPLADPEAVRRMAKEMADAVHTRIPAYCDYGTGHNMEAYNLSGNLPTRNFRDGYFPNPTALSAQVIKETISIGMESCFACTVRCKKTVQVNGPWRVRPEYGGPEYETLASFGSDCGTDNLKAVAKAHELCHAYGMDTIAAGSTIAFAMECFERGILGKADLDGIELRFGNADGMLALLEKIGKREGIGDLLAEGTRVAAARIGRGAEDLAMHVKGVELGMHDPRVKQGLGVGYCVANHGGDHGVGIHDTFFEKRGPSLRAVQGLGIQDPLPATDLSPAKVNLFMELHKWRTVVDSLCCCYFVPWTHDELTRLVQAVTGWDVTTYELMLLGERAISMGRAFNMREGLTSADDRLPKRFFSVPPLGMLAERQQAIDPARMDEAVRTYYQLMGWHPETGVPGRVRLEALGVGWVAELLA